MSEPMFIEHLKPRMIIRREIDGEVLDLFVCDIEKCDNQISGVVWRGKSYGQRHTFWVRATEELEVYSPGGARLAPGMTKAEIIANEVYERANRAGLKVHINVVEEDCYIRATVRILGNTIFDDTISATWMTRTAGRRTTRYGHGFEVRGALRNRETKRKAIVNLTKTEFYQRLGWACWSYEHKAA